MLFLCEIFPGFVLVSKIMYVFSFLNGTPSPHEMTINVSQNQSDPFPTPLPTYNTYPSMDMTTKAIDIASLQTQTYPKEFFCQLKYVQYPSKTCLECPSLLSVPHKQITFIIKWSTFFKQLFKKDGEVFESFLKVV